MSPAFIDTICNLSLAFENMLSQHYKWECCWFFEAGRCSTFTNGLPLKEYIINLNEFGVYRNKHGFFKKKKKELYCNNAFQRNWPLHFHNTLRCTSLCIITAVTMMSWCYIRWMIVCGKMILFADCELHLYPSQGSATIGDNMHHLVYTLSEHAVS